jgi:hypothetical protein
VKPFLIQPVGETEYGHLDKKVNYTPSFLTSLTSQKKIPIRDKHNGKIINEVVKLFYSDGGLYGYSKKELELNNKGVSFILKKPFIKEYDDNIELTKATITSVDVVDNPRNTETFLYNSAAVIEDKSNNNGDYLMGEETKEYIKRIGALETEVNSIKSSEQSVLEQLKTKTNDYDTLKSDYDTLKTKFETYENKENDTIESLAIELAEGDEELEAINKKMDLESLKVLKAKKEAKINTEIETKSKELASDNEELAKVYNKLTLEDLTVLENADVEWDKDLIEKYPNDRPFRGAGIGQNQKENTGGKSKDKESIKTRDDYNKVVSGAMPTNRPNFSIG